MRSSFLSSMHQNIFSVLIADIVDICGLFSSDIFKVRQKIDVFLELWGIRFLRCDSDQKQIEVCLLFYSHSYDLFFELDVSTLSSC